MNEVDLAIRMTADARDATAGMDEVGDAAGAMAREVDAAADKADAAASRMGNMADATDNVDTKMAGATASLGALSGGLEAAGFGPAATALQTTAIATDFLSGASQGLTLILESQAVMTARAKAATVAKAVADKAAAAATKTMTAGQWLLNAAMAANPVGIVVVAIAALVAGLILAYNKSTTFRETVDKAMQGAKTAVGWVVDRVSDIVGVVKQVIDKLPSMGTAFDTVKTVIKTAMDLATAPIRAVVDLIQKVIDKVQWLKDHGGALLGKAVDAVTRTSSDVSSSSSSGAPVVNITVQGALDPYAVALQIVQLLNRYGIQITGVIPV